MKQTREHRWETYFRAGYTVEGASDVIVDAYCSDLGRAEEAASAGAAKALQAIIDLGAPIRVTMWTQRWRTRRVEEWDDKRMFRDATPPARTEPLDLGLTVGRDEKEPKS